MLSEAAGPGGFVIVEKVTQIQRFLRICCENPPHFTITARCAFKTDAATGSAPYFTLAIDTHGIIELYR